MINKISALRRLVITTGLFASLLYCGAAEKTDVHAEYAYYQQISISELDRDQLVSAPLDSETYEIVKPDYADIRIVQDNGSAIPFIIRRQRKSREKIIEKKYPADIENLIKNDDNSIELIIKPRQVNTGITGIVIDTPLRDYERSVSVYRRSSGPEEWIAIATNELLYDYSRFADVYNKTIYFPEGGYERLKIKIHAVTDVQTSRMIELKETFTATKPTVRTETKSLERRPFRVNAVQVLVRHAKEVIESVSEQTYQPVDVRIENGESETTSAVIETRCQPITQIGVKTDSRNFSRPIVVEKADNDEWRRLWSDNIYDLSYRRLQKRRVNVKFPETRDRKIRLKIDNGDNPPISIAGVELSGNVYEIVFLAEPEAGYRLYYGHHGAEKREYDVSAVKRLLDAGYTPAPARLKMRQPNPDYAKPVAEFLGNKAFFIAIIALMVCALAIALYSVAKRV